MVPPLSHHILSDHPNKVRMFVLETDEPHADTSKEKGSFGEVLDVLFKEAGDEHNPTLGIETVMQYVVEDNGGKVPQFEEIGKDIHAILITGSVYDAHGNDKWIIKLIKLIERTKKMPFQLQIL
jgi:GMP synthase-like glutamine amidotransferase